MNIEDQLRDALKREPAPADFKRRLLQRVPPPKRGPLFWWKRRISFAVAAAVILAAASPALMLEQRRERGIEARDQLLTALKVANTTLRHTKDMIHKNVRRSS